MSERTLFEVVSKNETEKKQELQVSGTVKINEVLKVVELGCAEVTEKSYQKQISYFLKEIGEEPIESIKEMLVVFINQDTASIATRMLRKNAMKKYFRTVLKNPLDQAMIIEHINNIPIPRKNTNAITEDDVLSDEQVERIRTIKLTAKQRLVFEALVQTGLRASELTNIKINNIRPSSRNKNMVIITVVGKGNKVRDVYMDKELVSMVKEAYQGKVYLFEGENGKPLSHHSLYSTTKAIGEKAGLGVVLHPHMLRHTFATREVKKGKKSIKAISTYLGHSDIATTLDVYVHDVYTAEDFE